MYDMVTTGANTVLPCLAYEDSAEEVVICVFFGLTACRMFVDPEWIDRCNIWRRGCICRFYYFFGCVEELLVDIDSL